MPSGTHAFIYDDILNDRRFERGLAEIEARLTSLDIQGRIGRLTLFRNVKDLVESMVAQGVGTVVVVGNDLSLDKVMWFLPDLNVTLGYIPLSGESRTGELLGIPSGVAACDVLAARLVETVDMGKFDGRYFLTEVSLKSTVAAVDIEGQYRISPSGGGSIHIRNLGGEQAYGGKANAKDGLLEVVVVPQESKGGRRRNGPKETKIFMRRGEIISREPVDVIIDSHTANGFRFKLGIMPNKLKVITGRTRMLAVENGLA